MTRFANYDLPKKIVMFSTADWDAPLWTNKQQIAARLAADFQIVYVEPPAVVGSSGRQLLGSRWWKDPTGVTVFRPAAALPFGQKNRAINRANARLLTTGLNDLLHERGVTQPIVWCYPPHSEPFLDLVPHPLSCYDCVDEYSAFPGAWMTTTRRMEVRLIRSVDAVFTTARSLYEDKRKHNDNTFFVPNVADFDHFHRAATAEPPTLVRDLPRPVIGFVGALNYKIDTDLLEGVFRLRPQWTFVFVGPDRGLGIERFLTFRNARFLGRKDVADLPAIMAGFDACMIPYRINRYTHGVLPLKFFEYLATGKPVISTPLSELAGYAPMVDLASNPKDFVHAIERRMNLDAHRDQRIALARENSWEHRIGRMLDILQDIHQHKREALL